MPIGSLGSGRGLQLPRRRGQGLGRRGEEDMWRRKSAKLSSGLIVCSTGMLGLRLWQVANKGELKSNWRKDEAYAMRRVRFKSRIC